MRGRPGVVAGRPAQRVGGRRTAGHEIGGGQRGVGRCPDRLPGAGPDQRHRVVAEPARPARGGRAAIAAAPRTAVRASGRCTAPRGGRPCSDDVAARLPLGPDRGQVLDERGVVDGQDRVVVVGASAWMTSAPADRSCVEQHGRALGDLGAGLPDAEPDLAVRIVQQAVGVPHDGDGGQARRRA